MWTDKYIGIPYKPNGRDQNGLDCWGLVRLVYSEQYSIELPNLSADYNVDDYSRLTDLVAQYREGWLKVTEPSIGDVIIFKIFGHETHIGIVISSTQFLHVRSGYDSAIDNFTIGKWKHRVTGFYRYNPNDSIVMNSAPHPLKTQKYLDIIKPGTNLEQVYLDINKKYSVPEEISKTITIMVNGIPIPRTNWITTVLTSKDVVEYRAVPGKEAFRAIALIVVAVVAFYYLGPLASSFVAEATGSVFAGQVAGMVAAGATMYAGSALINAIAPITQPSSEDPGTSADLNLITGATNQFNPYGGIPIVLGKIKYTPPIGARNYMMYPSDQSADQYLHMILLWGYGPLTIYEDTMKIGEVLWTNYEFNTNLPNGGKITLDQKTTPTTEELSYFDQIYGQDVTQQYSGLEMVGPSAAEASAIPVSDTAFIYSDSNGNTYTGYSNSVTGMVRIPEVRTDPLFRELAA